MSRIVLCFALASTLGCSQPSAPEAPEANDTPPADCAPVPRPDPKEQEAAAFVERIGGRVERNAAWPDKPVVAVHMPAQATDADLKELVYFKRLTRLSLQLNSKITDDSLKALVPLAGLMELDMGYTPITDAGLKEVAKLPNLTSLTLSGTRITGVGLRELAVLKHLTALRLGDCREMTDADLIPLGTLKSLTGLRLPGRITDAGLKHLAPLTGLTELGVSAFGITNEGLRELAPLKNLVALDFDMSQHVSDVGMKDLAPLKKLTTIRWVGGHTDAGLAALRSAYLLHASMWATGRDGKRPTSATEVTGFELSGSKVADEGLKELADLENLATLDLGQTAVTDAGLKELTRLKSLAKLDLRLTKITDDGLKTLAGFKSLSELHVHANKTITDAGMKNLVGAEQLTTLNLAYTEVTKAGLAELSAHKKLTTLYIYDLKLTDAEVKVLKAALPKCEIRGPAQPHIPLDCTPKLTK